MLKITKNQGSIQVTADKSGFYPFDGTITFPTNSLFTATSANTDMITFKSTSNGDVQFVGNYKDITISGRSYDTKQKFLTAFSNLANQGSVDAYTKAETDAKIDAKQNKLKAGNGITLTEDATDNTTVVKTAVSLTDNGNGAYTVGDKIGIGDRASVRIGNNNNVLQGQNSIVIGDHAMTNAEKCIAIGNSSEVDLNSTCSIVIGDSARANGSQNIAIGDNRRCDGTKNVSIGCGKLDTVDVNGNSNVCIGENSQAHTKDNATVYESVAIGKNARSESSYSVAIGSSAFSQQSYGIAIGDGAGAEAMPKSYNGESIAIGHFARADGENSIALGYYSKGQKGGVAIGYQGKAKAEKGIAIGEWALASVENGVAIGELAQTTADSPLVIRAGNKTVDGRKLPITMIQGDANGKISIIKGDGTDERMVIQDEIEALKNAGGGTVDAYTKAETDTKLDAKQDKLTAGTGITIDENNVISSTGGSGGSANPLVNVKGTGSATIPDNVTEAVAIGSGARTSSGRSVAIGYKAETSAGTPMVINASSKTMIQSDANGKISLLKGDGTNERMVIQDEIAALKNAGGTGGTVDAYTKAETDTKLEAKQDKLTAGSGITITKDETAGTSTIATAVSLTDNGNGAYAIGDSIKIDSKAIALGSNANINNGSNSIVIGNNTTTNYGCVTIGYHAATTQSFSTAIGNYAISYGRQGIAVGNSAFISGNSYWGVAIGKSARAEGYSTVSIGYDAQADKDKPLVINAGSKTDDGKNPPFTVLQSDSTGKISVLLGDGTDTRMVISDEITALKAEITTLKAEIAALKGGASTGA